MLLFKMHNLICQCVLLQILEVYDYVSGLLRIGPFHYQPVRSAEFMLQQSDEFLLQHLTTSPEVEAAYVASEVLN